MTKKEQRALVLSMCRSHRKALLEKLKKVPSEWDGHELRQLFDDDAREQYLSRLMQENKRRMREYKNTRVINNI